MDKPLMNTSGVVASVHVLVVFWRRGLDSRMTLNRLRNTSRHYSQSQVLSLNRTKHDQEAKT